MVFEALKYGWYALTVGGALAVRAANDNGEEEYHPSTGATLDYGNTRWEATRRKARDREIERKRGRVCDAICDVIAWVLVISLFIFLCYVFVVYAYCWFSTCWLSVVLFGSQEWFAEFGDSCWNYTLPQSPPEPV